MPRNHPSSRRRWFREDQRGRTDTRIDARNAKVTVSLARPTTLAGTPTVESRSRSRRRPALPVRRRHERRRTHLGADRLGDSRIAVKVGMRAARIRSVNEAPTMRCVPPTADRSHARIQLLSTRTAEASCAAAIQTQNSVALIRDLVSFRLREAARSPLALLRNLFLTGLTLHRRGKVRDVYEL